MISDLSELVKQMKLEETIDKEHILEQIKNEKTLTKKYILLRKYLKPQSTDSELYVKKT